MPIEQAEWGNRHVQRVPPSGGTHIMTMIGVDTSPLQAAREWRGVSLVAAARTSGLALTQAEALEEGRADAFDSVDEMIASAVLYAATLGIGRDEAMALLDRTIARSGDEFQVRDAEGEAVRGSTSDFSQAVRNRSTTPSTGEPAAAIALAQAAFDNMPDNMVPGDGDSSGDSVVADRVADVPAAPATMDAAYASVTVSADELGTGELPVITDEMASEHASDQVRAALDLDPEYRAAWEQASSELETWAATRERWSPATERVRGWCARVIGEDRADGVADGIERVVRWVRDVTAGFRTWMRRSEHAPLIVAISAGIVLIALLIAVASAVSTDSKPTAATPAATATAPASTASGDATVTGAPSSTAATAGTSTATKAAAPAAILPTSAVHLQIVNVGHRKGYAATYAAKLKAKGYPIMSVGNAKTSYGGPVVLCPTSLAREQVRLSKQTGITTMDTMPASSGKQFCIVAVS